MANTQSRTRTHTNIYMYVCMCVLKWSKVIHQAQSA